MLELKNIVKIFNLTGNKDDIRVALNHVNLTIEDGEFVTVIGGNGSGKSTMMNIISGVLSPDEGSVIIDNHDVTNMKEHNRAKFIGRVFQDPMKGTAGDMSVLENLEIAIRRGKKHTLAWGFSSQNKQLFIDQLAKFDLGLETRLHQKVGLLSGGQRQALTLIMASIKKPSLLLLDEHTAALDPKTAKKVLHLTEQIVKEQNLTTIMITHNMRDALTYGNRLIMINNGVITLDVKGEEKAKLTPEDLFAKFDEAENTLEQ